MRLDRQKLLQLRAKNDWTQKEASERAGVSLPCYNSAEQGRDVQLLKANRIAKAYRIKLENLEADPRAEEVLSR